MKVPTLELLVLSCGGHVGWEGEASPIEAGNATITHQVMDRPQIPGSPVVGREYVQPQWVSIFHQSTPRNALPRPVPPYLTYTPPHLTPPHTISPRTTSRHPASPHPASPPLRPSTPAPPIHPDLTPPIA